jgi:DNA-binding response OmpR family regulator
MFDDLPKRLRWGHITVEPQAIRVWRNGDPVYLTFRKFQILLFLLQNPHRVVTREEIAGFVQRQERSGKRGESKPMDGRTIDAHVAEIRRRLGRGIIKTVRRVGYRLGDPAEETLMDDNPETSMIAP